MALLWIEGFEGFGTSTGVAPSPSGMLARKYPINNREAFMDIETGRYGYCLEIVGTADYIQTPNLTTNATMVCGCAIKILSTPASQNRLYTFYDGSTAGVGVRVNSDLTLSVYRGTTLLGSSSSQMTTGNWFYIEMKVLTNNSTGTVEVKVNGSSWISLTSQDTQEGSNAYHTAVRLGMNDGGVYTQYDDMYVLDGSGSKNNDFLGNRRVDAIYPDGAGDDTNWTPSAGSNYQNVDDGALLDEDTTYNETSTDGHDDLFTYDNLPAEASSVDGLMIVTEARVTTGSMDLSHNIKTGGTEYPGSAETITSTSYITSYRLEEDDPDTSVAWTVSGVNGAQFGTRANT